jgi:hypothetical protein
LAKKSTLNPKDDKTLKKVLKRFDEAWQYAEDNYHQNWEDNWKLYNNKRVKRCHDGVVKAFVPMTNSAINTIVASLFNNDPRFTFTPNYKDQEQDTNVISELIKDFSDQDGWNQKNMIGGTQCFTVGTSPFMYEWDQTEERGYIRKRVIPLRDFFCDPTSTDPGNWRYAGRRYFKSKKLLEDEVVIDDETGKPKKRFTNLSKVSASGNSSGENLSDKALKDSLIGSPVTDSDLVEVIEYYDGERVISIANRSVVIENEEAPIMKRARANFEARKAEHEMNRLYQLENDGVDIGEFDEEFDPEPYKLIPFALMRDYVDVSLIYGQSDVDLIKDQQELLNDLTELNIEAILYTLWPEKTLDPKYADWADDLEPRPGKVYTMPTGAMVWNTPPVVPNNAFNERANIKSEIRETTAIDQVVKGVTSATSQTATEIKAQLGQASQRIQMKAKSLENDFFLQEARICWQLIKLYITEPIWVRTANEQGVDFKTYDPSKFQGEYTPSVKLDITRELEKSKEQEEYTKAFQIIVQDPTNNLPAAKQILYKKIFPALTDDEISAIITPPTPPTEAQGATSNPDDQNSLPSPEEAMGQQGESVPLPPVSPELADGEGEIPPEVLAYLDSNLIPGLEAYE